MSRPKRIFLQSIAWVVLLNLIVKPLYIFGIDRTVQNTVGPEEYGLYYALFNLTFLFQILLDLGLTNFHNKSVSQREGHLTDYFGHLFLGKLLLAVFYFALTFAAAYLLNYPSSVFYLIFLLGINQFLVSMIFFIRANIAGMQWFRWDSIMSVLDRVVMIAVVGYLLFGSSFSNSFELVWFVYAQMGAYIVTILFGIGVLLYKKQTIHFKFSTSTFVNALKKSWPYALIVLFMTIYHRTDAIMIERMLPNGAEESGYYAQCYRILEGLQILSFLVVGILFPLLSKLLAEKKPFEEITSIASRALLIVACPIAIISYFNGAEILELLYKSTQNNHWQILFLLMVSFIPLIIIDVYGTLLTAGKSLLQFNIITGLGVLVNICLNWIIIPEYGAIGAATTTLITLSITAILSYIIGHNIYKFSFGWSAKLKFSVISAITVVVCIVLNDSSINLALVVLLTSITSAIVALGLRFISLKEIKDLSLMKEKNG